MKRRITKGIPHQKVDFGTPDLSPFAPLHRRLGIQTHTHRQAILDDPRFKLWDPVTRVTARNHLYRETITLAGAA